MRLPVMLEMAGQPVLGIGGGTVATAKLLTFAQAGATVTVVAPQVTADLQRAAAQVHRRRYDPTDLGTTPPPRIVVAGTGVAAVDDAVARDATARNVWCLRIDARGGPASELAVPAILRDGPLLIGFMTGAPALTARIRRELDDAFGTRWGAAARVLADLRIDPAVQAVLRERPAATRRQRWRAAVSIMMDQTGPAKDLAARTRAALMADDTPGGDRPA